MDIDIQIEKAVKRMAEDSEFLLGSLGEFTIQTPQGRVVGKVADGPLIHIHNDNADGITYFAGKKAVDEYMTESSDEAPPRVMGELE